METESSERYKDFPPGWGHLKIPVSARAAALAGLAMYAPCHTRAIWAHRVAWAAVSLLGTRALPGRAAAWRPPLESGSWARLRSSLEVDLGPFDSVAVYSRLQLHREGLILLLMRAGRATAFVKIRRGDGRMLRAEGLALAEACQARPTGFRVPEPLAIGESSGWHYLATAPLPPEPHRPPRHPPLGLIVLEIQRALRGLTRPPQTPTHWEPMHGDLTPWNLRQLRDRSLVLLDWEEAGWGPPGADEVLYRATVAALRGVPAGRSDADEAIAFWEARLRAQPAIGARDSALARSLAKTLGGMRSPPRSAPRPAASRPRVLVFAYACEPGRGSEPGAGWGLARAVAEFADCTVLVGPEHGPGIRSWEMRHDSSGLTFQEVPEPRAAAYLKWHRIPRFLLYLAWLRRAEGVARRLHSERPFDATMHATYAAYWLPTPAPRLGIPCVWGPVGGAVATLPRLWPLLGPKGVFDEVLDRVSVRLATLWPPLRRTWRDVRVAIVQNEETEARLPKALRARACILNHVMFVEVPEVVAAPRGSHILYLSVLESRKGPRLAIRALAHAAADVSLVMAGDGPERRALERLARRLNLAHRVRFLGQVEHRDVFRLLGQAAAVVFSNLREEGGVALAEAMLSGAPVIVLAHGGICSAAASTLAPDRLALIPPGGAVETARRMGQAMTAFSRQPPSGHGPTLDRARARRLLRHAFEDAGLWDG